MHGNVSSDHLSDRRANVVKLARALTGSASPRRGNPVAADAVVVVAVADAAAAGHLLCQKCAGATCLGLGLSETSALLPGARRPYFAGNVVGDGPGVDHFE